MTIPTLFPPSASAALAGSPDPVSALIARMTSPPDGTRSTLIRNLYEAWDAAGFLAKADLIYVLAAHDGQAARLNWLSPTGDLTEVSNPTFTIDRGYVGLTAGKYLDTAVPLNTGVKLSQNDWHAGAFVVTQGVSSANGDCGTRRVFVSSTASNTHKLNNRAVSTDFDTYINGAFSANTVSSSTTLDSNTCKVCAAHLGALGALSISDDLVAFASVGKAMSAGEIADMYAALFTYLSAIGAAS